MVVTATMTVASTALGCAAEKPLRVCNCRFLYISCLSPSMGLIGRMLRHILMC